MRFLIPRSSRGDTIVEVLLAIGIISMVLGGAYAATNKSLQYSRAAQERSEALKIAETQVEQLKKIKDAGENDASFAPISPFCVKSDGTIKENITNIVGEAECLSGERYYSSIEKDVNGVFQVRVLWENATGGRTVAVGATSYPGYDQAQLYYRAYSFNGSSPPFALVTPAPTITLTATPASVVTGNKSKLNWSSNYATSCVGSGAWAVNATSGTNYDTAILVADTTYTLTCSGLNGSATKSVTVTVVPPAPIVTFTAAPASVVSGLSSNLTWSTTNATSCTASGAWSGVKGMSGSTNTGALASNRTYTLTCDGAGGSTPISVTITVTPAPPTITLTASPPTVVNGEGTTITWSTTNVDATSTCTASGAWSGGKALSGSEYIVINRTIGAANFVLSCSGPGGSSSASWNVNVLYEQLTYPATARPSQYSRLCHKLDNRGSTVYYYSLPLAGNICAGGGIRDWDGAGASDSFTYNRACQMPDGRYAYGPTTATLYCPSGGFLR